MHRAPCTVGGSVKGSGFLMGLVLALGCARSDGGPEQNRDFSPVSRVDSGRAVAVMLTAYSTTLRANGDDRTRLRLAVTDSAGREITTATDSIRIYVTGDGVILGPDGDGLPQLTDTAGLRYTPLRLADGVATVVFRAGTAPDRVKVEARSDTLFPGSHEIHTISADVVLMTPTAEQLAPTTTPIGRMIGADISFLPQIENN